MLRQMIYVIKYFIKVYNESYLETDSMTIDEWQDLTAW
jgi:hypothetical protein